MSKITPIADAIALIQSGDVLAVSGYGTNAVPEQLLAGLQERFLDTQMPEELTLVYAGGIGDGKDGGLNRIGHERLLKRVIGGHYGLIPAIEKLAVENKIEAYNLPEGVITHLYRDIAAGKPGTLSKVGLDTFVDPRVEGAKVNEAAVEDIVELVTLNGEETLFFKGFSIDVVFIRGTTADETGNITIERESLRLETLAMAMAARNSGGIVICQVERVAQVDSLDARSIQIPGMLVDCVVVAPRDLHMQNFSSQYNPALSGEIRVPVESLRPLKLDERKVIARRAAMELTPKSIVNLGLGMPSMIGNITNEERIAEEITLTVDPGVFGGVPLGGFEFGASMNFCVSIDHPYQFDFIDGGGLDSAYLGFAECDGLGNVNASRFANRVSGCGGFINITQNSKKVVFVGTFTSGGLKTSIADGRLVIEQEGKHPKFVEKIGQRTFSGARAASQGRQVFYVTERCVFALRKDGLELIEIAPGIDIKSQVLDLLPFSPMVGDPVEMNPAIFQAEPMGLRQTLYDIAIDRRISYERQTNTLFLDYSGMRVASADDIDRIKHAVDATLEPLGRRVNAIVNYDSFWVAPDVSDQYLDLVRYVEERYYLRVSRYTTNGFTRIKLSQGLDARAVTSDLTHNYVEAEANLRSD
ncbi:MAG: acyl CoA:acetate/3-ketoacid CoA transferase [Alphaproteobacteria bacterium]|nr:acyl CoA:acetate/3-ketoacid CoA transferase [Alphaproteobacteria bacterium]